MTPARRSSRLCAATLATLATLLLGGCGSSAASPTIAPTATAAATLAATSAGPSSSPRPPSSVSVKLPKGWQRVELTAPALKAQIKGAQKSNPQLAATLQQVLDSGGYKSIKFYALGFSGTKLVGNLNVNEVPLAGASLDALQPVIEGEFKQLGATGIEFHEATVANVTSLVVDYKLTMKSGTATTAMSGRAFLIPIDDIAYDVTVTCYAKSPSACLAAGDKMANSLTLTP